MILCTLRNTFHITVIPISHAHMIMHTHYTVYTLSGWSGLLNTCMRLYVAGEVHGVDPGEIEIMESSCKCT